MKILIISPCTRDKFFDHPNRLTMADFQNGPSVVAVRESELPMGVHSPAWAMYTGQQHTLTMKGISAARAAGIDIELWILSAGYGLIPGHRVIAPYEATFNDMGQEDLNARSLALGLPAAFTRLVQRPYDFGMVLLGADYLNAVNIGGAVFNNTTLVLGSAAALAVPLPNNARSRVAGAAEAHKLGGAGSTAIKGEIARRFLVELAARNAAGRTNLVGQIMNPDIDPLSLIP